MHFDSLKLEGAAQPPLLCWLLLLVLLLDDDNNNDFVVGLLLLMLLMLFSLLFFFFLLVFFIFLCSSCSCYWSYFLLVVNVLPFDPTVCVNYLFLRKHRRQTTHKEKSTTKYPLVREHSQDRIKTKATRARSQKVAKAKQELKKPQNKPRKKKNSRAKITQTNYILKKQTTSTKLLLLEYLQYLHDIWNN